jgi:N-formylglutamate deformylase
MPPLATPPFTVLHPLRQKAALVLTSPHSGRNYPAAFLESSRLDAVAIRRSEDSFVEELFAAAPSLGVPLLAAEFPRAWCDVNREAWELDPAMFADPLPAFVNTASPRVQAGLGTIAKIVGTGEPIYDRKLRFAEAQSRIAYGWEPYHAALQRLIRDTQERFGACLVIDCHSMPSAASRPERKPDLVLGDVHGTTAAAAVTGFLQSALMAQGFSVRRNDPYAGGYITRHYGRPRDGVMAVQLELARPLYMNERYFTRSAQFESVQRSLTAVLTALIEVLPALLIDRAARPEAAE